uniref:Unkown protein n=1 Tax=Riptortus pedestris TaxID=329032 RepID=R4WJ21_RIPPE|nr:unkown protein [Riptortus pedestris]
MEEQRDERGERLVENNKAFKQNNGFELKNGRRPGAKSNNKFRKRRRRNQDEAVKQQFLSTASLNEDLLKDSNDEVMEDCEKHFSDEEWTRDEAVKKETTAPVSKILMDLSASYASESEDEDLCKKNDNQESSITNSVESDNEAPPEEKILRESDNLPNIHLDKRIKIEPKCKQATFNVTKKPLNNNQINSDWKPHMKKRPLTLLEKLLAKEIRQERNHILQCIRYIIGQNFFEEKKIAS